jgi:hypothetical protein
MKNGFYNLDEKYTSKSTDVDGLTQEHEKRDIKDTLDEISNKFSEEIDNNYKSKRVRVIARIPDDEE